MMTKRYGPLPGEERPYMGMVRDYWDTLAVEMRRGYYWDSAWARPPEHGYPPIDAVHADSAWGRMERRDPGLIERRTLARYSPFRQLSMEGSAR